MKMARYLNRDLSLTVVVNITVIQLCVLLSYVCGNSNAMQGDLEALVHLEKKVCIGTSGRLSVPSNREHHYQNLRDRYTNCTYVDGNLELTWLEDEEMDLSFLSKIREVTGYVFLSHVNVKRVVLPSLMIIRGRQLFKLHVSHEEFALMVTLSKMYNLEMPSLRDILNGNVGFFNNYNLCHVKSINWTEIVTGPKAKSYYVYNFTQAERVCPACDASCEAGCWGDGSHNCQKFSKINCSPQCHQGRCFGPKPRECCHLFCAGGCVGPTQAQCLACRNFYDDKECKQECPPMMRYNPATYSWENNPNGKYAYGATCVKKCPEHLLRDSGACVRSCPSNKKAQNGECVPCDGTCPKNCEGVDVIHKGNIDSFRDCTIIEGSLIILDTTFDGFQEVYQNFTFGPRHPKMDPRELEVFSTLKEVTGYVSIQAFHPEFKNMMWLRNLEVIGGRQLTEYFAALYIVKTSLESLNLRSLKTVRSGSVVVLENKDLCFADNIDWKKVARSEAQTHSVLLQKNAEKQTCIRQGLVCDLQCNNDGCWGQGPEECLTCKAFKLGNTCIQSCNTTSGIYDAGNSICKQCHEECMGDCFGPGPSNCTECRHVMDGPYCVKQCPSLKYNESGVCKPCHDNCIEGCTGPRNILGPGGCNKCEKVVVNANNPNLVEACLKNNAACPEGFYHEYVINSEEGILQYLTGKSYCRKCHPRCKNCTSYGFHVSNCECRRYSKDEQCEDECSRDHFADESSRKCLKCADECRGCYGPTTSHCHACRNFRVYFANNQTAFNCTASCPEEMPYKKFDDEKGDPYCSTDDPNAVAVHGAEDDHVPAILGGTIGCVTLLVIFFAVISYQWVQRAKTKENTMKMTMRMSGFEDEPLKPSNIKPNLAKLRIVKEQELRKGGILGYGAFGTVYQGVWLPEGDNVKIPVAIKVLREGTCPSTNKDFLEEAYIMASVDHPNVLKLLAVSLASQLMLVTQLMPLGCLLDYVRNNQDKIGPKPLLNWCTQIARGMAYLEEKRMVHRDLALRNVLLQTPGCIKITDFGLAKLLDFNEEEYKATGGKMPIKWLALECIQHRIFTHKSDVWAFGVTVWELLTYGGRPYENVLARDVPDLLEKGERLSQPTICTIDVYMIMIKCWMLDAESRPSFKELADEFAKMARDPCRYLVVPGSKLMRLPSYTPQDEKELIRTLSMPIEGPEVIMDAEEYLHPKIDTTNGPVENHTPPPDTPIKKFMDDRGFEDFPINSSPNHSPPAMRTRGDNKKYAHLEQGQGHVPRSRENSANNRYCSDPLKILEKGLEGDHGDDDAFVSTGPPMMNGLITQMPKNPPKNGPNYPVMEIPVDEDDYLMPSPMGRMGTTPATYMDLIGDSKIPDLSNNIHHPNRSHYIPDLFPVGINGIVRNGNNHKQSPPLTPMSPPGAIDNLEYHMMNQDPDYCPPMHIVGLPPIPPPPVQNGTATACVPPAPGKAGPPLALVRKLTGSSDEDTDEQECYNEFDRLQRELQPLNHHNGGRRSETTV